ncbi:uracil-5-carboxylate decarboxylase [Ophiocordyceps camponoti-floridani]|uniref:Uracil-5-carboxylate decarboxylase n=1 Tax=Ophiocordyceps camponoti-floridani TaxID=2030778 RepID=A0A8H4VCJ8_9HYPO|nr:uracil-5-carboxylate decarboxylase [Ophiocordyceps camponoti-floridani]
MYPPAYVDLLSARSSIPMVRSFPRGPDARLILLSAEEKSLAAYLADPDAQPLPGRPLTSDYTSVERKMAFMDANGIDVSVISLANPWLDFLDGNTSPDVARSVNDDFSRTCRLHSGRLFFFAVLPLTAPLDAIRASIAHIAGLHKCRGVILGTSGLGRGLDDPDLLPVFRWLADAHLTLFLHPHSGLPNQVWGPRATEYGHVLPLALGFPMETTIAVTRMYLARVFDHVPDLRIILAHSGGTLPFLAGRIESCILHDGAFDTAENRRSVWDVLKEQVYLDAVIYSDVGLTAAVSASGSHRLLFGTDHPFFPPLKTSKEGEWESVRLNVDAVARAVGEGTVEAKAIMGDNALRVLRLDEMA